MSERQAAERGEGVAGFGGRVAGYCPGCGGESLSLGNGGHVTCSRLDCRNPTAADGILHVRETDHIVEFREHDFRIVHPLVERLGDPFDMFDCALHQWLTEKSGPPVALGRYYAASRADGSWRFVRERAS